MPLDYYPSRMMDSRELEWLFVSAFAANMNVLRIWGGGMYMTDEFYEMADQTGMMIWHDMMFSCKFYPFYEDAFVKSSQVEVREQAGRLQHHSSIVMWVLNNEGETMIYWRNQPKAVQPFMVQYDSFYVDKIIPIIREVEIDLS